MLERPSNCNRDCCIALFIVLLVSPLASLAMPFAYVATQGISQTDPGSVVVIDTASNTVATTIPIDTGASGLGLTPDGRTLYVATAGCLTRGQLVVIDTVTNTPRGTIEAGLSCNPIRIAFAPDGTRAYVTNGGFDKVQVVDTASNTVVSTIRVGVSGPANGPIAIAITPDGAFGYVANWVTHTVSVFDTTTQALRGNVHLAAEPSGLTITPDGRFVYVTSSGSPDGVTVIDTATNAVVDTIAIGTPASGVAITPDGTAAYVAGRNGTVGVINTQTRTVTATIPVDGDPFGVALSADGRVAYAANFTPGTVSVIDTASNTVTATITVGAEPIAIAVAGPIGLPTRPIPTRHPPTPTQTASMVSIDLPRTTGLPGDTLSIDVILRTAGMEVAATQNDITADPPFRLIGCTVNPAIGKDLTSFELTASRVRARVQGSSATPIADGSVLYTCAVDIAPDASSGSHWLYNSGLVATTPSGMRLAVSGADGYVEVGVIARSPTPEIRAARSGLPAVALCSTGPRDGEPCGAGLPDCGAGFCVFAQAVCDGGRDDGLACSCAGGACSGAAPPACAASADRGACVGGAFADDCCDSRFTCADERPCIASQKVCLGGPHRGATCLRDDQCPASQCAASGGFCTGGDFQNFSCVDDADCLASTAATCGGVPALTPHPTRTPTPTRIPTPTRTPGVEVRIGAAAGRPGERVSVPVTLGTGGHVVAGVQNEIPFVRGLSILSCEVDPALHKDLSAFHLSVASLRALVAGTNVDPITDGALLYTCMIQIAGDALPGAHTLRALHVIASDPGGGRIDGNGVDGVITVDPVPSATATVTPSVTPLHPRIELGRVTADPGARAIVIATLHLESANVAATQNDITFTDSAPIAVRADGRPDCAASPTLDKTAAFAFLPPGCEGAACQSVRALIVSTDNVDPIPDGTALYSCVVTVAPDVGGVFPLLMSNVVLSTSTGDRVPDATGTDGSVTVVLPTPHWFSITSPPAHPGDVVTISVVAQSATLRWGGYHLLTFDAVNAPILANADGTPACAVNPDLGWRGTFAFTSSRCGTHSCEGVSVALFPTDPDALVVPGSALYSCRVHISSTATGALTFTISVTVPVDAAGDFPPIGVGGGVVTVTSQSPSDSDGCAIVPASSAGGRGFGAWVFAAALLVGVIRRVGRRARRFVG